MTYTGACSTSAASRKTPGTMVQKHHSANVEKQSANLTEKSVPVSNG